jgi:hypothetical protein
MWDVISGVEHLVSEGVADPDRMGAWVGARADISRRFHPFTRQWFGEHTWGEEIELPLEDATLGDQAERGYEDGGSRHPEARPQPEGPDLFVDVGRTMTVQRDAQPAFRVWLTLDEPVLKELVDRLLEVRGPLAEPIDFGGTGEYLATVRLVVSGEFPEDRLSRRHLRAGLK